jgi:hypothetical protein
MNPTQLHTRLLQLVSCTHTAGLTLQHMPTAACLPAFTPQVQLRGAYAGADRTLRSSLAGGPQPHAARHGVRVSHAASVLSDGSDEWGELGEGETVLELHVAEASLLVRSAGADAGAGSEPTCCDVVS